MIGVRTGIFRKWQSHLKILKAGNPNHLSGGVSMMESFAKLLISLVVLLCMSGFIGGNETYECVLAMARASLMA
mgnify:FL=1